jgi:hypothetical protein
MPPHAGRTAKTGRQSKDATVVVDRGMANPENLATIQAAGYHWLVAAAQPERVCNFDQYEEQAGWQEIVREASPGNEGQHKVRASCSRPYPLANHAMGPK